MTIQELKAKITAIDNQIGELNTQKYEVQKELKDAVQAAFESEQGVKSGDPIETRSGTKMFYDGFVFDAFRNIVCVCHPMKNDGTASKAIRHLMWSDFK